MSNESSDAFKIRRAHRPERLAGTRELGGVLEPTNPPVSSRLCVVAWSRVAVSLRPFCLWYWLRASWAIKQTSDNGREMTFA